MAASNPTQLLQWLVENQFLTDAKARQFASFTDSMALAKELIARDWLTPFQVNQIMQGKRDTLVLGSYRLLEKIGEGAMGRVFKCWSQKLRMPVAIKMIHGEHLKSKKAMDRFCREMETA